MFRHCGTRLSCDFVIAGRLFLAVLLVMSALSVVRMEDESPLYDVEDDEDDDTSIVIVDDDGAEDDSSEGDGPTEDDDNDWGKDKLDEISENIRTVELLNRDYVEIPRSTNDLVRRSTSLMTSSNGTWNIVVDILTIVDYKLYTIFLQRHNNNTVDTKNAIRKYYKHFFGEINSRFSGINDSELNIRVRLIGILIAQKRSTSLWSSKNANESSDNIYYKRVYLDLMDWLEKKNGTLPKHDHAMAFTGYKMVDQDGITFIGGASSLASNCKIETGQASSLIQECFGLAPTNTAIHELGHYLGAGHDGESPNEDCPATDNYIMAPSYHYSVVGLRNFFLFSPCSIRDIKSTFRSQNTSIECLLDSVAGQISILPGQAFTPTYQCKDFFGQNSGLCRYAWPRPDNFCNTLWCLNPDGHNLQCIHDIKNQLTPVLGSPCADGKVCKNGQCLNKTVVLESMNAVGGSTTRTKRNSVDLNAERTHG